MTFLEWADYINEKNWMVCAMFQIPGSARGKFAWKVTIGYRGQFLCLVDGVGSKPAVAIRRAWESRKQKFSTSKLRHRDQLGAADRSTAKPKKPNLKRERL